MIMSINCFSREGADGEGEGPNFCPYIYFFFINNSIGDYLFYIGYLYNVYSVFKKND